MLRRGAQQIRCSVPLDGRLDPGQQRWVVSALRALQLDRERLGGDRQGRPDLAEELLARPAAEAFSGRQRDLLRELFTQSSPQLLRDLTTLLLADLPTASTAREET